MVRQQRETVGIAKGTRNQLKGPGVIGGVSDTPPIDKPATLKQAEIDKNLARRARRLSAYE
jgi:hypothetical protein